MSQLKIGFAICAALFAAPLVLHGQNAGDAADNAADLTAIRQTAQSYIAAFNGGDAKAVAAHWTEDGEYIDQAGLAFQGQDVIEKAFEEFFSKTKGAKLRLHVESLHLPEENVAIEIGDSLVTHEGGEAEERGRYKAIHVKQDGNWKLYSVHDGPGLPPSNYQRLKDLEWMIGHWVDEEVQDDDSKPKLIVHTQARWSVNRNFVVRTFVGTVDDQVITTGTQRIGWYAPAKQIRSWTFDSDGGITVGVWAKKGDQWVVRTDHILRDGKESTETDTVTIGDIHSHTWQVTNRKMDGKALPDQVIKVQRLGTKQP